MVSGLHLYRPFQSLLGTTERFTMASHWSFHTNRHIWEIQTLIFPKSGNLKNWWNKQWNLGKKTPKNVWKVLKRTDEKTKYFSKYLHPDRSEVSQEEIWPELRLRCFPPLSANTCKSQLRFVEILAMRPLFFEKAKTETSVAECWGLCPAVYFWLPLTFPCSRRDPRSMNIHAKHDYSCSNPASEWVGWWKAPQSNTSHPSITQINNHHQRISNLACAGEKKKRRGWQSYGPLDCSSCGGVEWVDWRWWRVTWSTVIEKVCLMRHELSYKEYFVIPWPPSALTLTWLSSERKKKGASFF